MISCTMVTNGRVELVQKSIACYNKQTYADKELVIISQGSAEQNDRIREFLQDDMRFVVAPSSLSLGAMRNLSVEIAVGDIICQWDDDDLYHPCRLAAQYQLLVSQPLVGTCYSAFLKFFADTRQMYWVDWSDEHPPEAYRFLHGSIMFYKKYFHEYQNMLYPEWDREEDLNALQKLLLKGRIAIVSPSYHYVYVYHGGNTYNLAHHRLAVDTSGLKKMATTSQILKNEKLLRETFRLIGMDISFQMHSNEGVVFVYNPGRNDEV
jgi:glycosyltransferase involved in cell wall biosynthesis